MAGPVCRTTPRPPPTLPPPGGRGDRSTDVREPSRTDRTTSPTPPSTDPWPRLSGPVAGFEAASASTVAGGRKPALALLALPRRPAPLGSSGPPDRHRPGRVGLRLAPRPGLSGALYGGAARSMAMNLHNFVYGAADPWGTVLGRQAPGRALVSEALSLRSSGSTSGPCPAQVVGHADRARPLPRRMPRGRCGCRTRRRRRPGGQPGRDPARPRHISDFAAHPVARARRGRHHPGLPDRPAAFPALGGRARGLRVPGEDAQAWVVLPALFLAYLVAAPAASFFRRVWHVATATLMVAVVSLSYMSAVSLVPQSSRPYVDGSCTTPSSTRSSPTTASAASARPSPARWAAAAVPPPGSSPWRPTEPVGCRHRWHRRVDGTACCRTLGHDAAWLLLPTVLAAVWLFVLRRRTPRTDIQRARPDPVVRLAGGHFRLLQRW